MSRRHLGPAVRSPQFVFIHLGMTCENWVSVDQDGLIAQQRFSRSLRQQLTEATGAPC